MVGGALLIQISCQAVDLPVAQLRSVRPVVQTHKARMGWKEASKGKNTAINYGDTIRAEQTGSAQLFFYESHSLLTLKSGAKIRIEEPESDSQSVIVRAFGAINRLFLKGKDVEIRTAAATAAVRSASCSLQFEDDGYGQSVLTVKDGEVEFKNKRGSVIVGAGFRSYARQGSAPTAPERVDVSGLLSWTGDASGLPLPFELPPAAGATDNAAPRDPIDAAKAQLQSGDALGAQTAFHDLLDSPRDDEARAGLALAFLSNSQRDEARQMVADATTPLASGVRALLLLEDGDVRGAQQILEPLAESPNAPYQLVSLLALAQIQTGELAVAEQTATRAHTQAPQSAGAAATLAQVQFFRGNDKVARELARHAIELDPFSPLALLTLGRIEAARGNLDEARQALERAVAIDPKLPGAQRDLGAVELALDRWPRAERAYLAAIEQNPEDARAIAGLGTLFSLEKDAGRARERLERAVAAAPDDPFVRAQQLNFLVKEGDFKGALREGREFLARQSGAPPTTPATGATLGSDTPSLGALLISLSEAALFDQKLNEAQDYARRAVRVLRNSSPAQYQLGRVFLEQDRITQAQSRFLISTILDPNSARARYGLGFTQELITQGDDVARPLGQTEAAVEGAPNAALSLQNQSSPGASERLQAAVQDPTSLRAASRSFGDWQLRGRLGNYSQATGEISYLHESDDGRGLTALGLRRDTTQGVRPGNDASQSQASVALGRKAKNSPSALFAYAGYERVNPVTDADFDQPPVDLISGRERPVVIVGANIAQGQNNRIRMTLQLDRNSGKTIYSNGPLDSQYESVHGEARYDRRLSEKWNLNVGGSWGQRRSDIASLTDFSASGTPLKFFNNVNFQAQNLVGYARAAFTPSRNLKLEGELKVRSLRTHLLSSYYQEPADPAFPPSSQDIPQEHTQVLPSIVATYRADRSTVLRFRARRLLGAIEDFELLSPTDLFGFNSNGDVPALDFGSRGESYELEVNHTFSNSSFLRLGLFRVEQGIGVRADTVEKFNFSRVQGLRVGYEGLLNHNTSFFTSASWNGSRGETQNPYGGVFSPSTLSGLPDYSAEVGIQYLSDSGLFIQPSLGYIGPRYRARFDGKNARQELEGFPLLNLRIGKRFGLNQSFYIEGSNLLDRTYTLATTGFQRSQPGRQIRAGFTFRFF